MSSRISLYTIPNPCKHLADYKLKHGCSGYDSLQKFFKTTATGKSSVEMPNVKMPRCSFCNGYEGRIYLCLICSSFSCLDHTLLHAQFENDHNIAVDIERAELYCYICCDQIYDPDFDKAVMLKHVQKMQRNGDGVSTRGRLEKKKRKLNYEAGLDLKISKQLGLANNRIAKSCYPLGLRGLNNLGSTCFMNSVLQALIHAPPLLNYFLSGQHNRDSCRKNSENRLCLLCDMDVIFSAMFSRDRTPYSPAQFLHSWWQHSENLASYEQQDAHEFFISLLNGIHDKETKEITVKDNNGCHCIAHSVFSGELRSDVICMTCGYTSTTFDPCVDISINLGTSNSSRRHAAEKGKADLKTGISSLLHCLDLFTAPEKLGSDQKFYCENCKERQDSVKQMSISKLPLLLCLHVKRFEHSPIRKLSRKVDQHLQFPFSLDMTPYTSSSIWSKRFGNRIFAFDGNERGNPTEFEIFAVVTHTGMLESGHYVTYLRLRNQWYRCDDAWIVEVDDEAVRASECYMMFYVQKIIYHNKTNEELSCLCFPSRKDPFLPVAGCC